MVKKFAFNFFVYCAFVLFLQIPDMQTATAEDCCRWYSSHTSQKVIYGQFDKLTTQQDVLTAVTMLNIKHCKDTKKVCNNQEYLFNTCKQS